MKDNSFLAIYARHPGVQEILAALYQLVPKIYVRGLIGSARSIVVATVFNERKSDSFLCILNDEETAGYFYHDCCQIVGEERVLFFPSGYKRATHQRKPDPAQEILRTETLNRLHKSVVPYLIVTYPEALAEKVVSKDNLELNTLSIHKGERIDSLFVEEILDSYGFERVDYVYEPGQYAVRGSIVDVFSFSNEYPYRIDFFGDEVESIRHFDVESQLSRDKLMSISIISSQSKRNDTSFFSYLKKNTRLIFQHERWLHDYIAGLWDKDPAGDEEASQSLEEFRQTLVSPQEMKKFTGQFLQWHLLTPPGARNVVYSFAIELQTSFRKNFDLVASTFKQKMAEGYTIYILSDNEKQIARIRSIFEDRGDRIRFTPILNTLHEGFIDHNLRVCLFTDHQLFDRYHKYTLRSEKARSGKVALSLKEIKGFHVGDYIVHMDHGVGQFGGLIRMEVNGKMQEAVKLIYLNDDLIFSSIHSLHKLSKYRGHDSQPPKLHKLGSQAWENLKENTKRKVKDIAKELITLYAKRREEKGFAFSADTYLQQELEASFIYEDTPDQLKATNEVKADMESPQPMDRLVCGDVGFGKTEVAIRAAFKAAIDGKQTAVLVPTTLLAYQHYNTFRERLADFPVKVDYLSRARSQQQAKHLLEQLQEGKIDILIGTHRVVSPDVKFKDLGLLIIDEEQKFGVSHKEKLKQMKTSVDTLTLSATPIPRTLQFSLMGARDLSNINTPPPNRYPIQTEIHTFNGDIIREAIEEELSRSGQVFLVNNHVADLKSLENFVRSEIPDARIVIGHGQMEPAQLERIITDFINYKYDVLIATSIVENGIDIPNANTIIINNAQNFGLSDLHQLRGRVGRSNRKAFCYLLAPPLNTLSPEARRRLQAIENFSELGSGIHVAIQDLDIRGAGDMLGAEQSGFISNMGYEAYQNVLLSAVQELRNEMFTDLYKNDQDIDTGEKYVLDTSVDSDLELFFPPDYVPNDSERILLYKEMDSMEEDEQIEPFRARLIDRFGQIPWEAEELIRIVLLRHRAKKLGIERITLKVGKMILHLMKDQESTYYQSEAFDKLLRYVSTQYRYVQLREINGKRSVAISGMDTVVKAVAVLDDILNITL